MLVEIFRYKIHNNLPSGSQIVICGRTDRHEKLKIAFCSFLSAASSTLLL